MRPTLIRVDPERPDPAALRPAAAALRRGKLVAFPTETVYGLGAHALRAAAVRRIFEAKRRPAFNPLIVHTLDAEAARALAARWPREAERLAERFWPGPLTLVLPRTAAVPDEVSAGLTTVALRVPAHPVAAALLRLAKIPVAAPSANRSNALSPTTAEHVLRGLGDRVDVIVDGGAAPVGIESAVVDLSGPEPLLLRPGTLSLERLREIVPELRAAGVETTADTPRPAPGMLARHYAPRAPLRLLPAGEISGGVAAAAGERIGAVLLRTDVAGIAVPLRMPAEPAGYAGRLYAALHELDAAGCTLILVEAPPDRPEWAGVLDRLRRASHL